MQVARPAIKIALACDWFLPRLGGIEVHLSDLARQLSALGHCVEVLTTTPGPAIREGVPTTRLASARLPFTDLAISPGLSRRVADVLSAGGFEVVHAHVSVVSPMAFAAIRAGLTLGLPVVVTFHSVLLRAVPLLRLLDRLTGWSRAPLVLSGVSGLVAAQVAEAARGQTVTILPNGVHPDFWRRPTSRGAEPLVVTAMRLNAKKRPLQLLGAFALAVAGGRKGRLVIAGAGPERRRIEAAISRLGLAGRVELAGALSREELSALYARADVFAMPSIRESFGIASLEARCAGLPVVAMRAAGSSDFLIDGTTALLADNDADFAAHLRRLLEDPDLRARLGPADPGLDRFAWPRVALAHETCYRDAIARVSEARSARPGSATRRTIRSPGQATR